MDRVRVNVDVDDGLEGFDINKMRRANLGSNTDDDNMF